jgi:PKD repeat protein
MRARHAAVFAVSLATAVPTALGLSAPAASAAVTPGVAAAAALAPGVTAYYEMNEPAGATVMADSGPNHLDGTVDPTGVQSGVPFDGAVGYSWSHRSPTAPPASPERVVQIPDNANLEPGNGPFTLEIRYRTKEKYGNITQKGQSASPGGQWKIQAPGGIPSCLFKGSAGQVATAAGIALNDEQWHDLTCVYNSTGVALYVDGVFRSRKNGSAGTIDNKIPMTVGGKINCDQIEITCDYFTGSIDFIKITKAANLTPTAAFQSTCFGLDCSFGSSSSDPDGSVVRYAWDFGDGTTSTAASPAHTYAAPGNYRVRLTVTDNQGATSVQTTMTDVQDAPPIESPVAYVGSTATQANSNRPSATIPTGVVAGDRLLMVLTYNNTTSTAATPTGVTGWTRLGDLPGNTIASTAFTKVADAGDAGQAVTVPLSANAKYTLTVAAYTGAAQTPTVAFANDVNSSSTIVRTAPAVTVPLGAWVASYWADKSSTTTSWTPASGTARSSICGADAGRVCSLLADSGEPLPPGTYRPVDASTNAASDKAVMWSFVVAPGDGAPPANQAPTAAFTATCTLLACSFDSSGSHDSDGTIASYAWDFGGGDTSTDPNPDYAFAGPGSHSVTLTVTDDDGAPGAVTQSVDVVGSPPANQAPTAAFTATCTLLACSFDSSGSHDSDGTIASYAWDFGGGDTSTDPNPDYAFAGAGSHSVTLTVTDDDGAPGTVTKDVVVQGAPADSPVDIVGSNAAAANNARPTIAVPTGTAAGDRLVLALSLNNTTSTVTGPSGTGWTLLDSAAAGDMRTAVWTKVATAGMGGSSITVPLSALAKYTVTLAAYTGVDASAASLPFARATDTVNHAARLAPAVTVPEGAWVISYWADKSSTTTSWTPPGSVTARQQACGADAGRICSLFADSGASVSAGQYASLSASTNTASAKATAWSIVLPPAS